LLWKEAEQEKGYREHNEDGTDLELRTTQLEVELKLSQRRRIRFFLPGVFAP
jgi:hypothetical protein